MPAPESSGLAKRRPERTGSLGSRLAPDIRIPVLAKGKDGPEFQCVSSLVLVTAHLC